ncbi:GGDEF domain-containing protein [Vibrio cholerae]|nr:MULTISPECIES: GGDEF domain-containing protein [Vibrio]EGS65805.1 diguanylate cyclase domain protein [Vibrio paracholerae HE-09]ELJ8549073.1 GGDEF domain-containing protein [Vibrio cholerae]ELY5187741.1 GGDEF domain-containing protein [Vibrio cholerae]ELY5288948.1 GGDEF domain-containing protein [Vibrio cholerae]KFD81411.1 diguanylate cyclase domain protein [Vibrio paracholerae]
MSSSFVTSPWFRFGFPLLLLIAIWLGLSNVVLVIKSNLGMAVNLPYILFVIALTVAHIFKQSRIAMVAMTMLLAYWLIQIRLQTPLTVNSTMLELIMLSLLLPVACFLPYAYKNAGLFSKSFLSYLAILLLFIFWAWLTQLHIGETDHSSMTEGILFVVPQISRLPLIIVAYLISLAGIAAISVLTRNQILDVVVYSSIVLGMNALVLFHVPYISTIMFTLSGLLILVYLISAGYEMAFNDPLTQIPGRQALDQDLKHIGRKFTLAMLDVDHFKKFNDTYGHDTGDDVLKLVASRLREINGKARVYRYGGEEFSIIYKGKLAKDVLPFIEALRQDIESYELVIRNTNQRPKSHAEGAKKRRTKGNSDIVTITVSIGVCDSEQYRNPIEALKAADGALYKAKQAGRNCVKVAS